MIDALYILLSILAALIVAGMIYAVYDIGRLLRNFDDPWRDSE
jgi:hypothetical protein